MTIYQGSRFDGGKVYYDEESDISFLDLIREGKYIPQIDDLEIQYTLGMRLDLLAKEYYGDSQLDWIILDANPKYSTSEDIQPGDYICIPLPERVIGNV